MVDRILAIFALVLFIGFVATLAVYINRLNLWVVVIIVMAMAAFDFFQTLRNSNGR